MSRIQKRAGDLGQIQATRALRALGLLCIEKIGTPVKLAPARIPGTYRVTWGEKVAGDHRAVLPGGRSVLVETKHDDGNSLGWARLRPHQPSKLSEHAEAGGVSLLVWVHEGEIFIMQWPIPNFGPRKGISLSFAAELNIQSLDDLI